VVRFLLDTNVISELRKPKPHGAVVSWFKALTEYQILVSAVSTGELQRGIERTRETDILKATEIESWLEDLQASVQVLPMDAIAFREWARLMEGKSETLLEDAMIAATARVHGLTVATRNERDFASLAVPVFNPFE
jgi:predicted nucleic acid-binding protein